MINKHNTASAVYSSQWMLKPKETKQKPQEKKENQ